MKNILVILSLFLTISSVARAQFRFFDCGTYVAAESGSLEVIADLATPLADFESSLGRAAYLIPDPELNSSFGRTALFALEKVKVRSRPSMTPGRSQARDRGWFVSKPHIAWEGRPLGEQHADLQASLDESLEAVRLAFEVRQMQNNPMPGMLTPWRNLGWAHRYFQEATNSLLVQYQVYLGFTNMAGPWADVDHPQLRLKPDVSRFRLWRSVMASLFWKSNAKVPYFQQLALTQKLLDGLVTVDKTDIAAQKVVIGKYLKFHLGSAAPSTDRTIQMGKSGTLLGITLLAAALGTDVYTTLRGIDRAHTIYEQPELAPEAVKEAVDLNMTSRLGLRQQAQKEIREELKNPDLEATDRAILERLLQVYGRDIDAETPLP